MSNNKKIVALLAIVGLASFALLFFYSQSPSNATVNSPSNGKHSLFANDPNFGGLSTQNGSGNALLLRVIFAVLLVAVMGIAAKYISKKLLGGNAGRTGKKIHVTETVHLGGRKTLYLISVGNQHLLIGSTNERVTKLADVTDALENLPSAATNAEERNE